MKKLIASSVALGISAYAVSKMKIDDISILKNTSQLMTENYKTDADIAKMVDSINHIHCAKFVGRGNSTLERGISGILMNTKITEEPMKFLALYIIKVLKRS